MSKPIVYLVDDDDAVRGALGLLLRTYGMTVQDFADPTTFLARVDPARPGCLILDLRMPLITGMQLSERLRERGIDWPVIMITGHGDVAACRRAFKAGVQDFLTKPIDEAVLVEAIHAGFAALDGIGERREARALLSSLTEREREVFDMVCRGLATKDIALALAISVRTIDAHRANIAEKLGTSSVAEFVRLAMSEG